MNRGIDMRIFEIILNQYVKALESCENADVLSEIEYCKMRTYHDAIFCISTNYEYILFASKYMKREIAIIKKMFHDK